MSKKIHLSKTRGHGQGCMGSFRFPGRIDPEDIRVGDKIGVQVGDLERVGVVGWIDSDGERLWFKTADRQLIGVSRPGYTFTLLDRPGPALPTTPGALIRITADASGVLAEPAYAMLRPSGPLICTQVIYLKTPSGSFYASYSLRPADVSASCTWELVYEPGAGS